MLRVALNIGMNTSDKFGHPSYTMALARVQKRILDAGLSILTLAVTQSNTEPTVYAVVQDDAPLSRWSLHHRITSMAEDLHQDCIAVVPLVHGTNLLNHDMGALVGPHAAAWGEYDPQFFKEVH